MKCYLKISCCFLIAGLFMSLHFHADASAPKKGKVGEELTRANALFPRHVYGKDDIELVNGTRTLFIFLDEPKEMGAVSSNFLKAIYEKPGPIVVSASAIFNAFRSKTSSLAYEYMRDVIIDMARKANGEVWKPDILAKNKRIGGANVQDFVLALIRESFKAEEWLIKAAESERNDILFLLIPLQYIFELPEVQEIQKKRQIKTLEELQSISSFNLDEVLGLKVSGMKTVTGSAFLKRVNNNRVYRFQSLSPLTPTNTAAFGLIEWCENNLLFIEKSKAGLMKQWNIYLTGHGKRNEAIAGMFIHNFGRFLDFLEKKIITKLFTYETCESAGVNRRQVYEDMKGKIGKVYSFPIIAEGTTETSIFFALNYSFNYEPKKGLGLNLYPNYKEFAQAVESDKPIRYDHLFLLMSGALYQLTSGDAFPVISNFPLIRLPNRSFFQPVIPSLEITEFLATSRSPQASLNVEVYAKETLARQTGRPISELGLDSLLFRRYFCILLDARVIPFEVQCMKSKFFGSKHAPFILSTQISEPFIHIFSRFRTDYSFDLDDSLSFFSMFDHIEYTSPKVFLIRELIIEKTEYHFGLQKKEEVYWDVLIRLNEDRDRKSVIHYTTTKIEDGVRVKDTVEMVEVDRPKNSKKRIDSMDPRFEKDYIANYSAEIKFVEDAYNLERQKRDEIEKTLKAREKDKKAEGHRVALAEARKAAESADALSAL